MKYCYICLPEYHVTITNVREPMNMQMWSLIIKIFILESQVHFK